jgi:hypothetical protein
MVICLQIHSVLNTLKNFFNRVLNVHGVHDIRQMDIHTCEPLVPDLAWSKWQLLLEN